MNTNKEMNNLKIGDRVKVISLPELVGISTDDVINGMTGTVKDLQEINAGIEFDKDMGGHTGLWGGKAGYCWYVIYERLEKIDETKEEVEEMEKDVNTEETKEEVTEETKEKTFEQKILEVLREEIGVAEGEEFDVYKKGNMQWRCKFERNEFFCAGHYEFLKAEVWKNIIANFHEYTFKRKPFIPKYEEDYFFLTVSRDENISLKRGRKTWTDDGVDYGMLALGNVFRSEKEALASKDKLLEKLKKLQKGE